MLSNFLNEITSNADTYPLYDGYTILVLLVHRRLLNICYYAVKITFIKSFTTNSRYSFASQRTLSLTRVLRFLESLQSLQITRTIVKRAKRDISHVLPRPVKE